MIVVIVFFQPVYFGCQSRSEHRRRVRCCSGLVCKSATIHWFSYL